MTVLFGDVYLVEKVFVYFLLYVINIVGNREVLVVQVIPIMTHLFHNNMLPQIGDNHRKEKSQKYLHGFKNKGKIFVLVMNM